jgi:hypothetical protein
LLLLLSSRIWSLWWMCHTPKNEMCCAVVGWASYKCWLVPGWWCCSQYLFSCFCPSFCQLLRWALRSLTLIEFSICPLPHSPWKSVFGCIHIRSLSSEDFTLSLCHVFLYPWWLLSLLWSWFRLVLIQSLKFHFASFV